MKKIPWIFIWLVCISAWSVSEATEFDNFGATIIEEIPTGGYIINQPGTYVFKQDLTWTPSSNGAAILIQANNVILNMRGHKLKVTPSLFQTIGINAVGCTNVEIIHGKVLDFGLSGVQANQSSNVS